MCLELRNINEKMFTDFQGPLYDFFLFSLTSPTFTTWSEKDTFFTDFKDSMNPVHNHAALHGYIYISVFIHMFIGLYMIHTKWLNIPILYNFSIIYYIFILDQLQLVNDDDTNNGMQHAQMCSTSINSELVHSLIISEVMAV